MIAACLLLKVPQSVGVKSPLFDTEAEGILKVHVAEEDEIVKSVPVVEDAMVIAFCLAFQSELEAAVIAVV